MMTTLVEDAGLRSAFLERLHESARQISSPEFERWLAEREAQYLPLLKAELPWLKPVSLERMRERASLLLRIDALNFEQYLPPEPERSMASITQPVGSQRLHAHAVSVGALYS